MGQHRLSSTLACVAFVVFALFARSAHAANEVLKVVAYPNSGSNTDLSGGTVVFTIQVQETSGQPDTVDMYYSCVDSNNNPLPCSPDGTSGGTPGDTLSIAKPPADWPVDSCTVTFGSYTGNIYFSAYAVGVNGGGSSLYTQSLDTRGRAVDRHAHHAGVAGQNLIPSVAFKPLQDYVIPVTVSLAQGTDSKIAVYYSAYIQSGAAPPTDVACTPASEIISVGAKVKVTRPVVIHCFGQSGGLTFTASAKSLDVLNDPSLVAAPCTSTYNVPAAKFHAAHAPGPPPAGVAAAHAPTPPSGLTVSCGTIASTNQYVAAVSFPVEAVETHIRAFYHATDAQGAALDVFPDSSSFNVTVGILQTQNVLIDLSGNPTAPITFTVDGVAAHAGAFFLQPSPTFTPQAQ